VKCQVSQIKAPVPARELPGAGRFLSEVDAVPRQLVQIPHEPINVHWINSDTISIVVQCIPESVIPFKVSKTDPVQSVGAEFFQHVKKVRENLSSFILLCGDEIVM
jgi:hypothetical protein